MVYIGGLESDDGTNSKRIRLIGVIKTQTIAKKTYVASFGTSSTSLRRRPISIAGGTTPWKYIVSAAG